VARVWGVLARVVASLPGVDVTGDSGVEGLLKELCVSRIEAVRVLRFGVGVGVSIAFVEVALMVVGLSEGANESRDGDEGEDGLDGVLHRGGRITR